jgi:anti-sigma regulatory factor (Ser/Thr protein kinase)
MVPPSDDPARTACLAIRCDQQALRHVHDFVAGFAASRRIAADDMARVIVMLEELLTNLQKYGPEDQVAEPEAEITLALAGQRLTIGFEDDGAPFDPLDRPPPGLDGSVEERKIGGLGLFLVKELSHEAHYARVAGRNVVRLVRNVELAAG